MGVAHLTRRERNTTAQKENKKKKAQSSTISETATLLGEKLCSHIFIFSPSKHPLKGV
jgi:hypothetical protein